MKLIDLLVQELSKRGGWPEGADRCRVDNLDGDSITVSFCFPKGYSNGFDVPFQYAATISTSVRHDDTETDYCMITRGLYESALAASQKPAWNGEGLPPVGCECECQFLDAWHVCKVLFVGVEVIVGVIDGSERAFSVNHTKFRLIKSEAERKREASIEAMQREADEGDNWIYSEYEIIYDAIAAGKIPGVKLED